MTHSAPWRTVVAAAVAAVAIAACASQNAVVPPRTPAFAGAKHAAFDRPPQGAQLHVGRLRLVKCYEHDRYFCGSLRVALDPAGEVAGTIDVALAWLPHSDTGRPSSGTIVAVEGGPGYPSVGSRGLYRTLYAPLLTTKDLLLVDNRGTGASDAIDCSPLQRAPLMLVGDVTRCGMELGKTSDLFGTGIAADDMAAVLDALDIRRVDMYGDSYGTFFVQAFAGRHPSRVHTLVLDGAYPVVGGSPWYPSTGPEMRRAFDTACQRSPVCAKIPGSAASRLERLVAALRTRAPNRIAPSGLAFVMDSAGLDPLAYRDLDAAARAYLESDDSVPLARLVNEAYAYDEGAGESARRYSQGLFVAASCADNPQAYDMRLGRRERSAAWYAALARKRAEEPDLYAPFTIDEFLGIPVDYAYVPLCVGWPVPSRLHPPGEPVPPGTRFPDVPTLVLNGDLDTITTPGEGAAVTRLFPRAQHLIIANTGHVSALDDLVGCASAIVRRFTATGKLDAGCDSTIPAVHLVPSFGRDLDDVIPASPAPGNAATPLELRAAAAATLAAADVLSRAYEFSLTSGSGLRGGTFSTAFHGNAVSVALTRIAWTRDLLVSGEALSQARIARASAHLTLQGACSGTLDAAWDTAGSTATATIHGTVDGQVVKATMPAP
ncbi:MAG: alpha/beta fold hydrolase [Candidatus Tumulicola sp.]